MSRAYLETLADLPWSRFSGQAEPRQSGVDNSVQQPSEGTTATASILHETGCTIFAHIKAYLQDNSMLMLNLQGHDNCTS